MVFFFLPGLDTEIDRQQILAYNSILKDFGQERSQVLGVVKETARRVREVSDELGLAVPLLADASGEFIRSMDVDDADGLARRVTILADRDGSIVRRIDPAPPDGQAEAMLAAIRELEDGAMGAPRDEELEEPPS